MNDVIGTGVAVRLLSNKWEDAAFGPSAREIGEIVIADYTGQDETAVRFSNGETYYLKDGEFEHLPAATFKPGDRVRVTETPDPQVPVGTEGVVLSLDDPKLALDILLYGRPPADLNLVEVNGGFIGLINDQIELIEEAPLVPVVPQPDFGPGTAVRVIDNTAAAVEIGDEGIVISRDDERVDPFVATFAPNELIFVHFPGKTDPFGLDLIQVFDAKRLEEIIVIDEVPAGTAVIFTTSQFPPYEIGDRGVVAESPTERGTNYYYVIPNDDQEDHLLLARDEFEVSQSQPEADLAEWEKELLAEDVTGLLTLGQFVAFEMSGVSWGEDTEVRILNVSDKFFHLEIAREDGARVAPRLDADQLRLLGQALIEAAEISE